MYVSIDYLIKETLKLADENIVCQPIAEEPCDGLSVASLVESVLPGVARQVVDSSPLSLLDESIPLEAEGSKETTGDGDIVLPEDFRRLRIFMMSDWLKPVEEVVETTHPRCGLQLSVHPGLRASCERPLCVVRHQDGFKVLSHYGSSSADAEIVMARYIPDPVPDPLHRIWIPAGLLPPLLSVLAERIKDR